MKKNMLYSSESECCGCGACVNVCPNNAISFEEDRKGFLYPHIDKDKCVDCGYCKYACPTEAIYECGK